MNERPVTWNVIQSLRGGITPDDPTGIFPNKELTTVWEFLFSFFQDPFQICSVQDYLTGVILQDHPSDNPGEILQSHEPLTVPGFILGKIHLGHVWGVQDDPTDVILQDRPGTILPGPSEIMEKSAAQGWLEGQRIRIVCRDPAGSPSDHPTGTLPNNGKISGPRIVRRPKNQDRLS